MAMNQNKTQEIINKIPLISDKEKWVLTFDPDEGVLFYSPKIIPDNVKMFQVTDEFAIYLDKNKKIKGVMLEYYNANFIKHHPEFKELSKKLFGNAKKKAKIIDPARKKTDAIAFKAMLERTIIKEVAETPLHALIH